jgi:flagellar hook assembly protein FlgD
MIEDLQVVPDHFAPDRGQQTTVSYRVDSACQTQVEIVRHSEVSPEATLIRTLHDQIDRPEGVETLEWDGRDDHGQIVPPGRYEARVSAKFTHYWLAAYATSSVWVTGSTYLPALFKAGG